MQALGVFLIAVAFIGNKRLQSSWCIVVLCMLLALALEAINTTLEMLCNYVQPEQHSAIKDIKDVAAAVASVGPVMVIISLLNSLL